MRLVLVLGGLGVVAAGLSAQTLADEAWRLEARGEAAQAQTRLRQAAEGASASAAAVRAYAEFLDRYRDPAALGAYTKLAQLLDRANAPAAERAVAHRRLAILELTAGNRDAAAAQVTAYAAAGGTGLTLAPARPALQAQNFIEIPGPLHSFARMAAISPDLRPEDLLPALARNVVLTGYQAINSSEGLEETEYLKLVIRYLSQARELEKLAGNDKVIRIETCDSAITGDLLRILGYRMRGGCGADVVLETLNASRAFLTLDSGFPLSDLEQALRINRPFTLDYHPSRVPVLYTVDYWQSAKDKAQGEFIDFFLSDPAICRLYLALSKLDPETSEEMRKQTPAPRLKIYGHIIDFFGSMFQIRDGKAVVPGGARSEKAWADLVGASPDKGAAFFERLLGHDDGWMASYFDAIARVNGRVQDYLTDPDRLKRFYAAIRGRVTSPGPARPVFRSNTDMLLLTARLRLDADGKPHLPGNLEIWKNLFANHPRGKYDAKLTRAAPSWKDGDDVLEALFGLSRKLAENEPLKIFMALSDMERGRTKPLEPETVDRLARDYHDMNAQYALFSEAPALTDKTILSFLDVAHSVSQIRDPGLRADAAGTLQALIGSLADFRPARLASAGGFGRDAGRDPALLSPNFRTIASSSTAGLAGVRLLLKGTHSPAKVPVQDRMIDLLAGISAPNSSDTQQRMIQDLIRVFEAQRLVSLTTLIDLADNLDSVSRGEKLNTALAGRLATRITEVQLPRTAITGEEKSALAYGYWTERHVDGQRKINLRGVDRQSRERCAETQRYTRPARAVPAGHLGGS